MKIMIAGSTRLSRAAVLVCTSSSKKLGHGIEHLRKRSGSLADVNHFYRQRGENPGFEQTLRQRLPLADLLPRLGHGAADQLRADRFACRFERLHQGDAARQQGAHQARELRHLIFDPDLPENGARSLKRSRDRPAVSVRMPSQRKRLSARPASRRSAARSAASLRRRQRESAWRKAEPRPSNRRAPRLGHDERDQKHDQRQHKTDQHRRVDQRDQNLLADRQRQLLVIDVALDNLVQRAGTLPGQQRSGVNRRENPALAECPPKSGAPVSTSR